MSFFLLMYMLHIITYAHFAFMTTLVMFELYQRFLLFFFQHGESEFNLKGRIGGDSDLSPHGWSVWKSCFELFCLHLELF